MAGWHSASELFRLQCARARGRLPALPASERAPRFWLSPAAPSILRPRSGEGRRADKEERREEEEEEEEKPPRLWPVWPPAARQPFVLGASPPGAVSGGIQGDALPVAGRPSCSEPARPSGTPPGPPGRRRRRISLACACVTATFSTSLAYEGGSWRPPSRGPRATAPRRPPTLARQIARRPAGVRLERGIRAPIRLGRRRRRKTGAQRATIVPRGRKRARTDGQTGGLTKGQPAPSAAMLAE